MAVFQHDPRVHSIINVPLTFKIIYLPMYHYLFTICLCSYHLSIHHLPIYHPSIIYLPIYHLPIYCPTIYHLPSYLSSTDISSIYTSSICHLFLYHLSINHLPINHLSLYASSTYLSIYPSVSHLIFIYDPSYLSIITYKCVIFCFYFSKESFVM